MVTGAHQKTHTCQGKKRLEATAGGPQMFSELAYHNVSEITMLLDFSPPFLLCCLARILSYSQLLHTSKHISMCKFLWATC
jgi:hypothetical protein